MHVYIVIQDVTLLSSTH